MKVGLTGGSGIVGASVLGHLVEAGHDVRALARSTRSGAKIAALGAEPVPGDLLDPSALTSLVEGCELVFHVAGVNELCSRNPDDMWRVNVEGTRLVVSACMSAGVIRLVHTSSAVTVNAGEDFISNYQRSKVEAERLLFREARGVEVVSVNPASVQGPGRATGTGKLMLAAARGKLPFLLDTTFSLVDIDDCARGHLLAADHGVDGQSYVLSGSTVSIQQAVALIAEVTGQDVNARLIPTSLAFAAAAIIEFACGIVGANPPVCREAIRVASKPHIYDGSKATSELGLNYTALEETIRRTVEWFRREGLLAV